MAMVAVVRGGANVGAPYVGVRLSSDLQRRLASPAKSWLSCALPSASLQWNRSDHAAPRSAHCHSLFTHLALTRRRPHRRGVGLGMRPSSTVRVATYYYLFHSIHGSVGETPSAAGKQAPNLQNILRQSYDYLTIMPKLRSTYDRRLIHKTSYERRKAFIGYNSLAKS